MSARRHRWLYVVLMVLPLMVAGKEKEAKIHDVGLGYAYSSGESILFARTTNPFQTNHTYFILGYHREEEGLPYTYYDYWYGQWVTISKAAHFLESGFGWRRLWFQDQLAAGFYPHTIVEAGVSGYFAQSGKLKNLFRETSMRWVPYIQIGAGASFYTGDAIIRVAMGYVSTVPILPEGKFPDYGGAFLRLIFSSGRKPR